MLVRHNVALAGLGDSNNPNSPFNTGLNVDISAAPPPGPPDLSTQIAVALGLAQACTCVGGLCLENGNSCSSSSYSVTSHDPAPAAKGSISSFFDTWGMPILVGLGVVEVLALVGSHR